MTFNTSVDTKFQFQLEDYRESEIRYMFPTSVDRSLREIASWKDRNPHLSCEMNHRIKTLQMELGFLKMFIWFLPGRSRKDFYVRGTVGKGKLGVRGFQYGALDLATSKLLQKVELCKPKIREDCLHLLDFSSQREFSSSNELVQFISCTISNLRNLVSLKAGAIVSMKMQASDLIKKLNICKDFLKSTGECRIFGAGIQDYAYKTAYVSTIYWLDKTNEAMAARMKAIIGDLLQMVKFYSPEVTGLYVRILRVSKSSASNNSELGEAIASFVDFVLSIGFMKDIREELIFLMALVFDRHQPVKVLNAKQWNAVFTKAKALVAEIPSAAAGDLNQEIAKKGYILLGDFQRKTHEVMAEVRKLHLQIPRSSRHDFPATNVLGFIDFLLDNLGNLKETSISNAKFLPSEMDLILNLHNELVSVRPSLTKLHDVQNEVDKLKSLWKKITYEAYRADYVIDSCQIFNLPIWYNVICLRDVIEQIKFIKKQIKESTANQIPSRIINVKLNSGGTHLGQDYTSRIDEVVVGFKDEEETIIERLTRGSMKLDMVSIVGMPGQGKTTLAMKIYNSPKVRYHFNKLAWCFVTQVYNAEKLFMDIFREIDDGIQSSKNQTSAEKVRKCLKGRKYLIIMDDIWDITAWNALKLSFPDDNNGSRVLFTSRNDFGCNPYVLRPLSEEHSMELLKQKLHLKYDWLSYEANKILEICNGLPLAIVAVAGLLSKVSSLWEWWKIVENLKLKLADDGCMDILELSYKSLPDFLRPCFLYLGVVGQNKVFKVKKLIHLWIAEGFVKKSGIKTLEEVAKEYLEDLVSRSLIIVNKRNFSSGKIKECRIHDLMYEMCSRKAEEERFIHFSDSVEPIIYDQYRLLCSYNDRLLNSRSKTVNIRSLFFRPCLRSYDLASSIFNKLKFLRVLDFGNSHYGLCFPEEIVLLIFLRYVSIRCEVEVLPPSIGNLCNLEFFHLLRGKTASRIQFPDTIWKMKRLKDVDVGPVDIELLDDDNDANVCPDQLCYLDSFSSLHLSDVKDAEKILRGFPRVRKLKLDLSELWHCGRDCDQFQVLLNSLSKLQSLSLDYYREMDHDCAFNLPITLKSLTLSGFKRPWSVISTIGKLPQLEVLKLQNSLTMDGRWDWDVEDEAFMNLRYLKLLNLGISHWEASTSSFPCIERIVVIDCPFLEELPSIFGQIATLKMIESSWCKKCLCASAERILNEQLDLGNEDFKFLTSDVFNENNLHHFRSGLVKHRRLSFPIYGVSENFDGRRNFDYEADNFQKPIRLEKKGVIDKFVDRRCVRSESRTKPIVKKYNCQPRQLIMSRRSKMQLKRD